MVNATSLRHTHGYRVGVQLPCMADMNFDPHCMPTTDLMIEFRVSTS
jgi:hypothetical protein